jgi:transposase/competence protein ComGC
MILDFQQFSISEVKQQSRLAAAEAALGKRTIERLLAFSSYLLGGSRQDIAQTFHYSIPGLTSMVQRVYQQGPEAFTQVQGPRQKSLKKLITPEAIISTKPKDAIETEIIDNMLKIKVNIPTTLEIPFDPEQPIDQLFILKCQNAGLFSIQQAADLLKNTPNQIQHKKRKLEKMGGVEAVLDLRQGQQNAYKFSDEAQSALIYHLVEDLIEHRSISSIRIHDKLSKALKLEVSDRTVRNHLENLGLSRIKANLIEFIKKKIPSS